MHPVRTSTTDTVLGAPHDWDAESNGVCEGLPIARSGDTMFSFWRPSLRERFRLLLGGRVRLGVFGQGHPPVSLDTIS